MQHFNKFTIMKNSIIKKILFVGAITTAVFSLQSCGEDFLDLKPEGQPTIGDIPVGGNEVAVFGLYSVLRTEGGVSDFSYEWTHCIRADDDEKGSTVTDAAADGLVFNNFAYIATNGNIKSDWVGHYKLIFNANQLINSIEASGDTTEGTLINLAEAKAIRAFSYFELRRDFGEVPVNLKTITNPEDEITPKNTIAEVDAQIIKDLTEAEKDLPSQWSSAYLGRVTKGFANTILAKLYLYQKNWTKSLEYSEKVINSGVYRLSDSYGFEFTKDGNNSKESIFEIQKSYDFATKYTNNFYESQGVRGSGTWDLGWGFNVPSQGLVDAYEPGDVRKKTTILVSGGPDIYDTPGYTLPDYPGTVAQKYWNGKAYTLPSERIFYAQNKNLWEDTKIFRYADVLLMAAEAANELGMIGKASTYLNMIRTRAGLANTTASNQATLRTAIKNERRVEFAMEFERFYDLVRWDDATTVLSSLGYQDKNKYFPIPQDIIDKSNGVIKQNPNY